MRAKDVDLWRGRIRIYGQPRKVRMTEKFRLFEARARRKSNACSERLW